MWIVRLALRRPYTFVVMAMAITLMGILAILRIGQGIALGGAWDGLASLLALNAPEKCRGWYAMVPQLGAPLGLIVASGLFAFFIGTLGFDDFFSWGWRYPFFVAFAKYAQRLDLGFCPGSDGCSGRQNVFRLLRQICGENDGREAIDGACRSSRAVQTRNNCRNL